MKPPQLFKSEDFNSGNWIGKHPNECAQIAQAIFEKWFLENHNADVKYLIEGVYKVTFPNCERPFLLYPDRENPETDGA